MSGKFMSSTLPPEYSKISIIHTASGACVFECELNDDESSPNSRGTFAVIKVLQQLSRDVDFGNLSRSVFIPRAVGSDRQLITAMSLRFTALLWISCELQANIADCAYNWVADRLQNFEATFGDEAAEHSIGLPDAEAAPHNRAASEVQLLKQFSSFSGSLNQTAAPAIPRKANI
jgi:hypothetical protein